MASVIVSNTGSLVLNDGSSTVPKGGYTVSTSNDKVYVKSGSVTWTLDFNDTTLDGADYGSAKELAAALSDFSRGGTGPGTGVQSVTGDGVGGTPSNPVLTFPTPGEIGAATSAQGALADTAVQPGALSAALGAKLDVPTGTASATTYARGDGTWATPPNTTYSAISQANIESPASTATGLITGQRLAQGVIASSRNIVAVSGSKTLALTDEYTFQNVTAASTITVPANATVALPVGSQIDFFQAGAGVITFAAAGGVTIISKGSTLATTEAGDAATLKKTATNTWALIIGG